MSEQESEQEIDKVGKEFQKALEKRRKKGLPKTCQPMVLECAYIKKERRWESEVGEKKPGCRFYEECLDIAVEKLPENGYVFSCEKCPEFKKPDPPGITEKEAWAANEILEMHAPGLDF